MSSQTDLEKKTAYEKVIHQELAKFDINPFIVDANGSVILAKRISTVQYGGTWHMPGGKVFVNERVLDALKRMTRLKTGLEIDFMFPTLNESVVGVYDDPKRDPREHVLGITFFCKIVGGDLKPDGNVSELKAFSPKEALGLALAFGHDYMLKEAFNLLKKKGS